MKEEPVARRLREVEVGSNLLTGTRSGPAFYLFDGLDHVRRIDPVGATTDQELASWLQGCGVIFELSNPPLSLGELRRLSFSNRDELDAELSRSSNIQAAGLGRRTYKKWPPDPRLDGHSGRPPLLGLAHSSGCSCRASARERIFPDVPVYSSNPLHITVTVQLLGSDWGDEEAEERVLAIVDELQEARGALGEVGRPREEAPPGSKGLGSAILGAFYAILNPKKLRAFLGFIRERLGGRAASIEVVADGRSMRLSLGSADDLSVAVSECIRFVEATAELSPSPTEPIASKEAAISAETSPGQLPEPPAADPRALGTTTGSSSPS